MLYISNFLLNEAKKDDNNFQLSGVYYYYKLIANDGNFIYRSPKKNDHNKLIL